MEPHERQKINIEILFTGDGRTFLNFWNWKDGDDVIGEFIAGKLIHDEKEITINEFINKVDKSYNK